MAGMTWGDHDVSTLVPQVCVAMLSYNRPHYLITSIRAIISYMTMVEQHTSWTIQILDNGSQAEALTNILLQLAPLKNIGHIRMIHVNDTVGLSRGFNLLFFDMCASTGAPYILSLEDDWKARLDWSTDFPIIQAAMQLLIRHEDLLEVWMRESEVMVDPAFKHNISWQQEDFNLPYPHSPNMSRNMSLKVRRNDCGPSLAHVWGGYTNGASLKHVGRLRALGKMRYVDGEADYSTRACSLGFKTAFICKDLSCYDPVKNYHTGLFEHIGVKRVDATLDARYARNDKLSYNESGNESLQDLKTYEAFADTPHRKDVAHIKLMWKQSGGEAAAWAMASMIGACFGVASYVASYVILRRYLSRVRHCLPSTLRSCSCIGFA